MKVRLLSVLVVVLLASATACSTLPSNTDPQVIRSFQSADDTQQVAGPTPGQEPDLLLRGFIAASAFPAQQYQASRAYLTEEANRSWNPTSTIRILDRVDANTQPGSTADERRIVIRGTQVGTLATGGVYLPANSEFESEIIMRRIDGEWRIDTLPDGLVMERADLRNQYSPFSLYFFDPSGDVLVSDRRWISNSVESLNTALIALLVSGPSEQISPGVVNQIPTDSAFLGVDQGTYQFTGLTGLDEEDRLRFAAQVVWTLAMADITGPYSITADGEPLVSGFPILSLDDVAEHNPLAFTKAVPTLFALQDGVVSRVSSGAVSPLNGLLGSGEVDSVAISTSADVAAVVHGDEQATLSIGSLDGSFSDVLTAETITRPTFEYAANGMWVVVDGQAPVRVARSATSGELVQTEADLVLPEGVSGSISEFQLSPTGVRAGMIIDGRVYVGIVTRPGPGERRVINIIEVAPSLAGSALSLAWRQDGSLLVGTSVPELPIWRVEQDGSATISLPSGNISAPVVAVASSATTMYATDAHAMVQLPVTDSTIWRETPGLLGTRAAPVVAY